MFYGTHPAIREAELNGGNTILPCACGYDDCDCKEEQEAARIAHEGLMEDE